jgi:hypothetical protein
LTAPKRGYRGLSDGDVLLNAPRACADAPTMLPLNMIGMPPPKMTTLPALVS